jgi:tripartite-type tricarboxylate transporter receptor subunit TctC
MRELGYDVEYYLWTGLFAPRSTPAGALKVLRDAARKAVQDPEFKSAMEKIQTPIAYLDADEFKAAWDQEARALAEVIRRIGRVESK